MVSPARTKHEPPACLAMRPVSRVTSWSPMRTFSRMIIHAPRTRVSLGSGQGTERVEPGCGLGLLSQGSNAVDSSARSEDRRAATWPSACRATSATVYDGRATPPDLRHRRQPVAKGERQTASTSSVFIDLAPIQSASPPRRGHFGGHLACSWPPICQPQSVPRGVALGPSAAPVVGTAHSPSPCPANVAPSIRPASQARKAGLLANVQFLDDLPVALELRAHQVVRASCGAG